MVKMAIYTKFTVLPFLSIKVGRVLAKRQEGDHCPNIPLPGVCPGMAFPSRLTERCILSVNVLDEKYPVNGEDLPV